MNKQETRTFVQNICERFDAVSLSSELGVIVPCTPEIEAYVREHLLEDDYSIFEGEDGRVLSLSYSDAPDCLIIE